MNDCIRFMVTDADRELLQQIAHQEGDAGMSATLRKLIRAEARRRGIADPPVKDAADYAHTTVPAH